MTFRHLKGRHRARPLYWLRWFPLLIGAKLIRRRVRFSWDSKYELPGIDQHDTNKLFGVAFGPVHRDSVRFGWYYKPNTKRFAVLLYAYTGGVRRIEEICSVPANHWYTLEIRKTFIGQPMLVVIDENGRVEARRWIDTRWKLFGWLLGPYFGGNNPAPKDIEIEIKRI